MILNPTISLKELNELLREALKAKLGHEIGAVYIESHNKIRIIIHEDGMVESDEFKHRPMP